MSKRLSDLWHVFAVEWRTVLRDPAAILIMLIVPGIYPLLYAYVYDKEVVSEVPVVVVDESHSALGRQFTRMVDASRDVQVVGTLTDMARAEDAMARKHACGIVYIPAGFSKDIHTGVQTTVKVYADMGAILHYRAVLLCATGASLEMGADIRVAETGYRTPHEDETARQAVVGEWVPMYNIPNGFAAFFIPAVLILVLQQTMLLGIATLTGTHNDRRTFRLASPRMSGREISSLVLTFGKALCYVSLYLIISVWVLRVVPWIFHLPQIGNPVTLAFFILPLLLSCTFFCLTLSYFCSQREFGMLLFAPLSVMMIFLSGVSWPWNAMPGALKGIAYLFPSTPGIHGFVRINTMGADLAGVWPEYLALWIQAFAYWIAATLMHRRFTCRQKLCRPARARPRG